MPKPSDKPDLFAVLAEPSRRKILDLLREHERSVGELVGPLDLEQPTISKHLRLLREAGLVEVRADARRRIYRLHAEPLADLDNWLAPYRSAWATRFDALERQLDSTPDP
ncbi:ArsR/SmtB family transcription factor [Nocardia callitridis]|uniref:Metalloregulator ArsR/SmtB family transcription factor n=1 Tax=Nocardia callitridis TaxID=648753 RepID=A0ABP9K9U0_9NOCA